MPTGPEAAHQHAHPVPLEVGLPRESSVSVNTAMSVTTIVAGSAQSPKLLDRVRALIRTKHYSIKTERIHVFWIRHFVRFHGKRHRLEMGKPEVEAFLSHLANAEHVAASTRNQALAALLFLYKEVLEAKLPWLDGVVRAKRPKHLPVVLTKAEVDDLLAHADGTVGLSVRPALVRKYLRAAYAWGWQYVFPANGLSTCPRTGAVRRHHIDEKMIQRNFHKAGRQDSQGGDAANPAARVRNAPA